MTNTEAIKLLSRFPKDTPLIIEWFEREDFHAPEMLWDKVCTASERKLATNGWHEDIEDFIDFIAKERE
jgi:hypothetical protein